MEIKVFFSRHGRCVGGGVRERKGLLLKSDPRVSVDGRAFLSFGRLYFLGVLWRNVFCVWQNDPLEDEERLWWGFDCLWAGTELNS